MTAAVRAYDAGELKGIAKRWLRLRFPEADILEEFSVAEYGAGLIDVAAILPTEIVGVEIKGAGDSAARLGLQGGMYSRICRRSYLLCCPSVEEKCQRQRPYGWGPLSLTAPRHAFMAERCVETGIWSFHPKPDSRGLGLAPAALAAMVWVHEYGELRRHLPLSVPIGRKKDETIRLVSSYAALPDIERAVCATLRARNWERKDCDRGLRPARAA